MKHLVVDISAHGFGYIAQTSAVFALDTTQLTRCGKKLCCNAVKKHWNSTKIKDVE